MAPPGGYFLGPGEIFTLFFVTLGPLKLLGPFTRLTRGVDSAAQRQLALRAIAIATVGVLAGGFLGVKLLAKWNISAEVMLLAGGLVLLLVALRLVLAQYEQSAEAAVPAVSPSPFQIAFPGVVTPYGIAAVITLLAASADSRRTMLIVGLLAGVLALDLLAMLFSQAILRTAGWLLQILGAVLGVLQVGLAVEMMLFALRHLGLLPGKGG